MERKLRIWLAPANQTETIERLLTLLTHKNLELIELRAEQQAALQRIDRLEHCVRRIGSRLRARDQQLAIQRKNILHKRILRPDFTLPDHPEMRN